MAIGPKIFEVASHFRFEVGAALASSTLLSGSVGKIADTADQAQAALTRLGQSALFNLGIVPTGIASALTMSVRAAENMRMAQVEWANLISMNEQHLTGPIDTFNQKLVVARSVLRDISMTAAEFGIPEAELEKLTRTFGYELTRYGITGTNFELPLTLARNLLKSAPALGVYPEQVLNQARDLFGGYATRQNTLFNRLTAETSAMTGFKGRGGTKLFNALELQERVSLVNEAMGEFSQNSKVLEERLNSISGQINKMRSIFSGFTGILTKIGAEIRPMVIDLMKAANEIFSNEFKAIAGNIADMLYLVRQNPRLFGEWIVQLTQLKEAFRFGSKIVGITSLIGAIFWIANLLVGGKGMIAGALITVFGLTKLIKPLMFVMGALKSVFIKLVPFFMMFVVKPLLAILAATVILSRAMAKAKLADIAEMPRVAEEWSALMQRTQESLYKIAAVFDPFVDLVAEVFAPFFQVATWEDVKQFLYEYLVLKPLESVAEVLHWFRIKWEQFGVILSFTWQAVIDSITSFSFAGFDNFSSDNLRQALSDVILDIESDFQRSLENASVTSKTQVNINKVSIENKFAENAQPDRIAFTIKDQLMDMAESRTQGRARPLLPVVGG